MGARAKVRIVSDRRRWPTAPPPVLDGDDKLSNVGADLAGMGAGHGTDEAASAENTVSDESGLDAEQTLEQDMLTSLAT